MDRTCAQCGEVFAAPHGNTKVCSAACRYARGQERRAKLPCSSCGQPTRTNVGAVRADPETIKCRACTRSPCGTVAAYNRGCRCGECRRAQREQMRSYYAKRKAAGRPMGKGRPRYKNFQGTCRQCGSNFRAEHEQPFCSMACFGDSNRRVYSTELVHVGPAPEPVAPPVPVTVVNAPKWWGVLTYGPCTWCEANFMATGSTTKYCSQRCSRQAGEARRGEFAIKPRLRYGIYQRDNWTCQLCLEPVERGATGVWRASLDHIVPQSKGGSHDPSNLRLVHLWCNAVRGDGTYHKDFFKVVTEGGALRVRPDGRSTEDLARSA